MPDYEIFAPNDAVMQQCLAALGMSFRSGKNGNTVYAVDYYGTKKTQSGTFTDQAGHGPQPNWVALTGVYANVRWMGASALGLPANLISAGATMKLLTAPYYRVFMA
jgi:hypothetical protein